MVKRPKHDYPTEHPAWRDFVEWIATADVCRADLLRMRDDDWKFVWNVFLAGRHSAPVYYCTHCGTVHETSAAASS